VAGRRREQRAISGAELRPRHLAAQDLELVTQNEQLDVLDVQATTSPNERSQQGPEREVEKREGHGRILPTRPRRARHGYWHPSGFRDHDGYDGVFPAVPGTNTHLEFTTGGRHRGPAPHPESLLVLYLGSAEAVRTVATRLGVDPVASANPYWAEHGATLQDPDGFPVVLVPERWEP
jgi:hypothetical protein